MRFYRENEKMNWIAFVVHIYTYYWYTLTHTRETFSVINLLKQNLVKQKTQSRRIFFLFSLSDL